MAFKPNIARLIMANIGSFWADMFTDSSTVEAAMIANVTANEEAVLGALDAVASISRFEIPVFRRHLWSKIAVPVGDIVSASRENVELGDDYQLGPAIQLGTAVDITSTWKVPVSPDVARVRQLVDNPASPSVVWTEGVDFEIDRDNEVIVCFRDPTEQFPIVRVTVDGVDENHLVLWGFELEQDIQLVQNHFGFVVQAFVDKSSENFKLVVNALIDTLMRDSNVLSFRECMAAIVGVPVVREDSETVEAIVQGHDELQVITDAHAYVFDPRATPTFEVGDTVSRGDILVDTIQFFERDQIEDLPEITGISIPASSIRVNVHGSLTFTNQNVEVTVTEEGGRKLARFELGGFTEDVEAFWSYVRDRTLEGGTSVAQLLRDDDGVSGEPLSVVAETNPMQFLLEYLLKSNVVAVLVKLEQTTLVGDIKSLLFSRKLTPAHIGVIFVMRLDFGIEEMAEIEENESSNYDSFLVNDGDGSANVDEVEIPVEILIEVTQI